MAIRVGLKIGIATQRQKQVDPPPGDDVVPGVRSLPLHDLQDHLPVAVGMAKIELGGR